MAMKVMVFRLLCAAVATVAWLLLFWLLFFAMPMELPAWAIMLRFVLGLLGAYYGARIVYACLHYLLTPKSEVKPPALTTIIKGLALEFAGAMVATVLGLLTFWAVFGLPIHLGREELMLAWGWVGWIPGFLLAFVVGRVAYGLVLSLGRPKRKTRTR